MGDRANIVFKQDNGFLGLYVHNAGYRAQSSTAKGLKRVIEAGRQKDEGYATRIVVSEIIGDDWSQEYSYGLYVGATLDQVIADNEHHIILVDWSKGSVTIHNADNLKDILTTHTLQSFIDYKIGDKRTGTIFCSGLYTPSFNNGDTATWDQEVSKVEEWIAEAGIDRDDHKQMFYDLLAHGHTFSHDAERVKNVVTILMMKGYEVH